MEKEKQFFFNKKERKTQLKSLLVVMEHVIFYFFGID